MLVARISPAESVSHAMPIAPLRRVGGASASSGAFDLSLSSDVSVSVPGVTTRTTLRSTGPLLVAGSPICSQIATLSPSLTSLPRYCSTATTGTPAILIGAPGRVTACGQSQVKQPRAALRIVVKQLVKIAHPIEQQGVRMLGLDAPVLLHHRCVRRDVDSGVHARTAIDQAIVRARDARRRPASTVAEKSSAMRTRCDRLP